MSDILQSELPQEGVFSPDNPIAELDEQSNEIAELSKKGYQFLKENNIKEAEDSFKQILDIENNNNYALVGLGDSARKQNHFYYSILSPNL